MDHTYMAAGYFSCLMLNLNPVGGASYVMPPTRRVENVLSCYRIKQYFSLTLRE